MADPKIKIKRSAVAGKIPTTNDLELGELAINTYDGKVFIEQDQGGVGVGTTVIVVNPWSVGVGSDAYDTYFTAGNVGVGTTNPTSKLTVSGDVKISGATTAGSFVKSGGTSSEFLKADGSVDSSTYLTSYTETDTLDNVLSRGNVSGIGISVGISTVNNHLSITSTDGNTGRLDLYCEVSNAHYTRIEAAPHSEYSGNATIVAPTVSGDIIVGDTASAISQNLNTTGIITASSFSGSGTNLTGIVTSITAGSGISVDQSTGNVTITATGGGGGSSITVQDEGSNIGTAATTFNFVGSGVVASYSSGITTVTISGGGGGAIGIQSGGTEITASAATLNFVGTGITMADNGSVTDITIPTTTRTVSSFTATNGQTEFTGLSYTVGYIDVYLNGAKLDSTEYTASNGTSVTLTTGASTDDIVETIAYSGITVVDLVGLADVVDDTTPQLGGNLDLNSNDITGTGDFNITGIITATTFSGNLDLDSNDITGTGDFNVTGIITATTFSGSADLSGLLKEGVNITAGKLSSNTNIDLVNGMVHLFTTTETATSTPNIRYDASNSLDSKMNTGESITVVLISAAAAAGYSAQLTIDGSAVTEEWLGGSAPTEGGSSGYDVYTYNIIKTGSATFIILANLVNFA